VKWVVAVDNRKVELWGASKHDGEGLRSLSVICSALTELRNDFYLCNLIQKMSTCHSPVLRIPPLAPLILEY
jgi:hypothetical protein